MIFRNNPIAIVHYRNMYSYNLVWYMVNLMHLNASVMMPNNLCCAINQ